MSAATLVKAVPQSDSVKPLIEDSPAVGEPSHALARFAPNLRHQDIPESVQSRARHRAFDAIGISFASSKYDFAHWTLNAIAGLSGSGGGAGYWYADPPFPTGCSYRNC